MPVDKPNVIDFIGIDKVTGIVKLTISDHLEWDDINLHLSILEEKINKYLGFIESNEIIEVYPNAKGKKCLIHIAFMNPPPQKALEKLNEAQNIIREAGYELTFKS